MLILSAQDLFFWSSICEWLNPFVKVCIYLPVCGSMVDAFHYINKGDYRCPFEPVSDEGAASQCRNAWQQSITCSSVRSSRQWRKWCPAGCFCFLSCSTAGKRMIILQIVLNLFLYKGNKKLLCKNKMHASPLAAGRMRRKVFRSCSLCIDPSHCKWSLVLPALFLLVLWGFFNCTVSGSVITSVWGAF